MSYCRFGDDSDVYMYAGEQGIVCCGCHLSKNRDDKIMPSATHALEHLEKHARQTHPDKRHKVPQYALHRLREEVYGKKAVIGFWCGDIDELEYKHGDEIPYDEVFETAEEISGSGFNVMIVNNVAADGCCLRILYVDKRQFQVR